MMKKKEKLLTQRENYLSAGAHIGMTFKTADMKKFIYKIRPNGLAVLNVGLLDQRIRHAASLLSTTKKVLVISKKEAGQEPAEAFAKAIGAKSITKRFMPGSLTNPTYKEFFEPDVIIVTDPMADKQALKEAVTMRIPIIGLADTFNETSFLDMIIPCNNKGKKSLALVYWLLAKEIKEKRGEEFKSTIKDFGGE